IRNSYRTTYALPGGGLHPHEDPLTAASRELREEVGVLCEPKRLHLAFAFSGTHEHQHDLAQIFEVTFAQRPTIHVDDREVVWAAFLSPEILSGLPLCPILQAYLRQRETHAAVS
ncbi:MAG: NUDIX hydrolase, partial [Deltaproteobacteria bacterium]|nr:NUDIX hydrolase [Deltaproteobacteria bacterium]